MAFTSHSDSAIDVCFENILIDSTIRTMNMLMVGHLHGAFRTVELDVDIGSSALDYAALQKSEVPLPLTPFIFRSILTG